MIEAVSSSGGANPTNPPIDWQEALATFDYEQAATEFEAMMNGTSQIDPTQLSSEQQGHLFFYNMYNDMLMDGFRRSRNFVEGLREIYDDMQK